MKDYKSISDLLFEKSVGIDVSKSLKERELFVVYTGLKGISGEEVVWTNIKYIKDKLNMLDSLYRKVCSIKNVEPKESILIDGYYSATIEGARTTIGYVKSCFNNPVGKSEKMVVNTYRATVYAKENNILSEKNLLKAWSIIVGDVCENVSVRGSKYRSGMVYVGNSYKVIHIPPNPAEIQGFMNLLFNYIKVRKRNFHESLIISIIGHFYLVYVHPMCDGNGRLARLLMLSYLNECGFGKVLNISISKSINEMLPGYYKSLSESEKSLMLNGRKVLDVTPFILYMIDVFERSMSLYIGFCKNNLTDKESLLIRKMKKRGEGSEITVVNCMKALKVSESTSRKVLNALVEKGLLGRTRVGRKFVYKLL